MTWRYGALRKLHSWGLRGNLPLFLADYLRERTMKVKCGNALSTSKVLENGIPQGSPLSVTLFAIAINDIASGIDPAVHKCLYVDDLAIFCADKTVGRITRRLQPALNQIISNAENSGFKFSREKTKCVHFCRLRRPHYDPVVFFKDRPIPVSRSVRFLGLIFDDQLRWREHIEGVVDKCRLVLNIFKVLAGTKWGADPDTLLQMHHSLLLSKMEYGCVAYSSARKSTLARLDHLHHAGIRYSIGAFRTSPIHIMLSEAGFLPLSHRRDKILSGYVAGIRAQPDHPNYKLLFSGIRGFLERPTITRPAGVRAHELFAAMGVNMPSVLPFGQGEVPPWMIPKMKIFLKLAEYVKEDTPVTIYRSNFLAFLEEHRDSTIIYTDGSRTESGVGCAVYVEYRSHEWTLPPMTTVYGAELYALWQALLYCLINRGHVFLIVCDSLSVMAGIRDIFSRDPLIQRIQAMYTNVTKSGKLVEFAWIPSHVGIHGNELVDAAAKRATRGTRVDVQDLRPTDLKAALRLAMGRKAN
ncbi:uncharacterized protein LOC116159626 [Photinus pyralis]|uniref:uncharacterized protein LOC116159626 n=1 Tax=Photinus pyralis TaxID=7054 RepID=UPI0012676CF8|nr:uncharacterized protein LOC116159626 [Photinus pyralis]